MNLVNKTDTWVPVKSPIPKCNDGLKCLESDQGVTYAKFKELGVNDKLTIIDEIKIVDKDEDAMKVC